MRILLIILWLLLGLAYYFVSIECCDPTDDLISEEITSNKVDDEPELPAKELGAIWFDESDAKPQMGAQWETLRDSLMANLGDDQLLQIQGLYFDDESQGEADSLGMARARNVLNLFDNLAEEKTQISSRSKGPIFTLNEVNNLVAFRFLRNTKKIKEIDDRTIIYFAFNSTNKLSDAEVETYLDDVVERVSASNESIQLVGHSDNIGNDATNLRLGEWRVEVIEDYLIKKGLNPSRILVSSRGESSPIATNNTEQGRQQNRRVELQIIK